MRNTLCFVLVMVLTVTLELDAQIPMTKKHSITFDPALAFIAFIRATEDEGGKGSALIPKAFSLTYAYRIDDEKEITINTRVKFPTYAKNYDNSLRILGSESSYDDPFWIYEAYTLRVGYRKIFTRNNTERAGFYYEPMVYYKYAYFNNALFLIDNEGG